MVYTINYHLVYNLTDIALVNKILVKPLSTFDNHYFLYQWNIHFTTNWL